MKTLTETEIIRQAHRHDEARRLAIQIEPVSVTHPQMSIDDAYGIQAAWLEIELQRGRKLV